MKHKRIIAVVLMVVLSLSLCTVAFATAPENDTITPRYSDIASISANLTLSNASTGQLKCTGSATSNRATDTVKLTAKLQRYNNGIWTTIKTWTANGSGYALISKYYSVVSGYTYRLQVTTNVYSSSGTYLESATVSSTYYY